jgi:hypothetical protein
VRKLLLYGFLGLMCYHLLGFFTYFEWKRYAIKSDVKNVLEHSIHENRLIKFHFSEYEMNQIHWKNKHEFVLLGRYYDVFKLKKSKEGVFIECISDCEETKLFRKLNTITSFNLGNLDQNQPVNVWFKFVSEPMLLTSIKTTLPELKTINKRNGHVNYCKSISELHLFIETPPPDAI